MSISCFFDRNEIHIQAFGDVFYGEVVIVRSSSSRNYIKIDTQVPRQQKRDNRNTTNMVSIPFNNFENFRIFRFSDMKIICLRMFP